MLVPPGSRGRGGRAGGARRFSDEDRRSSSSRPAAWPGPALPRDGPAEGPGHLRRRAAVVGPIERGRRPIGVDLRAGEPGVSAGRAAPQASRRSGPGRRDRRRHGPGDRGPADRPARLGQAARPGRRGRRRGRPVRHQRPGGHAAGANALAEDLAGDPRGPGRRHHGQRRPGLPGRRPDRARGRLDHRAGREPDPGRRRRGPPPDRRRLAGGGRRRLVAAVRRLAGPLPSGRLGRGPPAAPARGRPVHQRPGRARGAPRRPDPGLPAPDPRGRDRLQAGDVPRGHRGVGRRGHGRATALPPTAWPPSPR